MSVILFGSSKETAHHPALRQASMRDGVSPTVLGRHMRVIDGATVLRRNDGDTPRGEYYGRFLHDELEPTFNRVDPRVTRALAADTNRIIGFLEKHPKYNPKWVASAEERTTRIKRCCKGILDYYCCDQQRDHSVFFLLDGLDVDAIAKKKETPEYQYPASELRKVFRLYRKDPERVQRRVLFLRGDLELTPREFFSDSTWDYYQPRSAANPHADDARKLSRLCDRLDSRMEVEEAFDAALDIADDAARSVAIVAVVQRFGSAAKDQAQHIATIADQRIRDLTYKDVAYSLFDAGCVAEATSLAEAMEIPHLRTQARQEMCHHFIAMLDAASLNDCAPVVQWLARAGGEHERHDCVADMWSAMSNVLCALAARGVTDATSRYAAAFNALPPRDRASLQISYAEALADNGRSFAARAVATKVDRSACARWRLDRLTERLPGRWWPLR